MRELLAAMKSLYGKQQSELDRMSKIIATGGPFPGGEGGADASVDPKGGEVAVLMRRAKSARACLYHCIQKEVARRARGHRDSQWAAIHSYGTPCR